MLFLKPQMLLFATMRTSYTRLVRHGNLQTARVVNASTERSCAWSRTVPLYNATWISSPSRANAVHSAQVSIPSYVGVMWHYFWPLANVALSAQVSILTHVGLIPRLRASAKFLH